MTKQETFDIAVGGVIRQGKASVNANNKCMYRLGSLKCAAGHLISDEDYRPEMETKCSSSLTSALKDHNTRLVKDLQRAHDTYSERENFIHHFTRTAREVANTHNLTFNEELYV